MLNILGDIKLIIGTIVAVAMLGVGYKVGSRQVDALEAEIKTIKSEGDSEETRRKKAQAEIDKALAEVKTEHARQMEQLKAEGERKAKELDAALVGRDSRIADLQAQMSVNKAREAKLTGDLVKASPAERTKLQEQISALRAENAVLVKKTDANECLVLAVPDAVIGPLVK